MQCTYDTTDCHRTVAAQRTRIQFRAAHLCSESGSALASFVTWMCVALFSIDKYISECSSINDTESENRKVTKLYFPG